MIGRTAMIEGRVHSRVNKVQGLPKKNTKAQAVAQSRDRNQVRIHTASTISVVRDANRDPHPPCFLRYRDPRSPCFLQGPALTVFPMKFSIFQLVIVWDSMGLGQLAALLVCQRIDISINVSVSVWITISRKLM
jgi:hypothetical protein